MENPVKVFMPAKKPAGLNVRHDALADAKARVDAESALVPRRKLPMSEPVALKGHPVAAREWRRLIALYNGIEAEIVSRLDIGMLLDYCMLIEQMDEMDALRAASVKGWRTAQEILDALSPDAGGGGEIDIKAWAKAQEAVNWAYDKIIKIDGRVDRKRALLLQLRQSLYLTPRSRAGVAPAEKPKEEPKDEMEALLESMKENV